MWLLERHGLLDNELVARLADDPDRLVRVHLILRWPSGALWPSTPLDLPGLVLSKLEDDDPFVRRVAADALGRHPRGEQIEPLLAPWRDTPADDTHLVHILPWLALREHLLVPEM